MTATTIISNAQSTFVPDMGEIAQLRIALAAERIKREQAERERDELAAIIRSPQWTATERIAYASIRLQACKQDGPYLATNATTIKRLAESAGLSTRTFDDKLEQFKAEGLLEYETHRWGETKNGKVIARRNVDKQRGDKFMAETTITKIPAELFLPLPEIGNGKNAERSKVKAEADRKEFKRVKDALQAMVKDATCPHCNEIGQIKVELSAKCHGCGVIFTEAEVEFLAHTPDTDPRQAAQSEPIQNAKFADKKEHAPELENPPLHIEIVEQEPVQTANFASCNDITEPSSELKRKVCATSNKLNTQTFPFSSGKRDTGEGTNAGGDDGPDIDWSWIMGGGANV